MKSPGLKAHAPDLKGEQTAMESIVVGDAVRSDGNWWIVIYVNKSDPENVVLSVRQLDQNGNVAADGGGLIGYPPGREFEVVTRHINPKDLKGLS